MIVKDFQPQPCSLSLIFYKETSFSFFFSPFTVNLEVKEGLIALGLNIYEDRALHTSQIKLAFE